MCGIFGVVGGEAIAGSELAAMSGLLRHRGPDDEGFMLASARGPTWLAGADTPPSVLGATYHHAPRALLDPGLTRPGGVALGHRRLSILDLSAQGHQPMAYRDRYAMVYNGEVYNYVELRAELAALGHRFTSATDSEVILAAYDAWGPEALARFNGMWALAILDLERKTLFLARDRFGVKPLYLWQCGARWAFASEIKAFTALHEWRARANLPRLLDFLVWNVSDHGPDTMFEEVRQLPAGHHLLADVSAPLSGRATAPLPAPTRWYVPGRVDHPEGGGSAALRAALTEAVRLRLRSDVPVGSCLSGGLDSSSIVCLMGGLLGADRASARLRTFTARSDDAEFDETRYAKLVAAAARAEAAFVTPRPETLLEDLSRLIWHQDEPFVSSSIFAQWCVFREARRAGVVVMLDGQGADEILGGYRGFFGAYLAGLARRGNLSGWWRESGALRREIGFGRVRSLGYTAAYLAPALLGVVGRFDHRAYADRGWLARRHARAFRGDPVRAAGGRARSVREMSLAQISATNLPMLLHWEDRNSMAFSVEARVPFLDYRVVELCLGLDEAEKVGGGVSKAALRAAMRGVVPAEVLERRDKMGFVTAEPLWMRRDRAEGFRRELATAVEALPGVLDPSVLKRYDSVVAGHRPFDHRYWRALCAGRWATAFRVAVEG